MINNMFSAHNVLLQNILSFFNVLMLPQTDFILILKHKYIVFFLRFNVTLKLKLVTNIMIK